MLTPVLKFSEIKKNPSLMTRFKQAAVVRYGDVVAYVVSHERMEELLAAEEQYENGYLNDVADSRMGQKRICVDLDDLDAAQ